MNGAGEGQPTDGARGRSVAGGSDVEGLLRRALAPVEPPADLSARVRGTLLNIREVAAEELEGWELASMRDPRNWVRPAVALVGGTAAGAGLVILRMHQRHRDNDPARLRKAAGRVAGDARKLLRRH